ncbi:MAG TPA: hypothetical protein VE338_12585 [Ktedonobacterales bacterium]|nr:hypothetical protein [Ktedonobacterales bacterium]
MRISGRAALIPSAAPGIHGDQLRGLPLALARVGWVLVAMLVIALNIAGIPVAYASLATVCQPGASCLTANLTPQQMRMLPTDGMTIHSYAANQIAVLAVGAIVFILVGLLIFLRRSTTPMALFASITLVVFGGTLGRSANEGLIGALMTGAGPWFILATSLKLFGSISFPVLFYLFPSGHWAPRWTRWLVIPLALYEASLIVAPRALPIRYTALSNLVFMCVVGTTVIAQVYRYRRVSTHAERQQTKWVVYGFTLGISAFVVSTVLTSLLLPQASQSPREAILVNLSIGMPVTLVPISIGIAILRSRLFDIDVIINRTLTYGAVTATLTAIYFICIVALQQAARLLSGQQTQQAWVIVLSTLVIAALFQPLRSRLQAAIDRRFYRSRYNAARTLEQFIASLRSEVDLTQLTEQLIATVDETMRPSHAWLWLRSTPQRGDRAPQ